jgi:hypothetical protein
MKHIIKRTMFAGATFALLVTPVVVSAHEGHTVMAQTEPTTSVSPSPSTSSTPSTDRASKFEAALRDRLAKQQELRQANLQDVKQNLRERLDASKKKACENHQTTINRLMTVMDKRRENALDRITKISDAVQAFYVKKDLTVANYDDLVANVTAAKTVAESATAAQQAIPSLDCSGDHPRADVADFKEKRSASIDAVKAYRDAVKDLLKAVKTAASDAKASPSTTPEGGDQ